MLIQGSISNRSWFKPQWAKLLVFIALIVPLLGMKKGNQEAEAGGLKSGSLKLHKTPPKGKTSEEVSFLEAGKQFTTDLWPTAFLEENPLKSELKASLFPREDEEPANRKLRLKMAIDVFKQRNAADTKERTIWLQLTVDYLRGGHFDFASKLMETDPSFFRHSGSDFAFSHEALAQLAKKTEVDADDLKNLASIIANSNCAEWSQGAKIKESCKHIKKIQSHVSTAEEDQGLLKSLTEKYDHRASVCGGKTHAKTECLVPMLSDGMREKVTAWRGRAQAALKK